MGPIKRIDLSQNTSVKNLVDSLKGMGELRVSHGANTAGDKVVFLRERTLGETIKDFFGIDATSRQRHADEAAKLIEALLIKNIPAGKNLTQKNQIMLNIRTETGRHKGLTGRIVAAEVVNFLGAEKVSPLKGGPVAAPGKALVNLMSVSPMRVVADHAILNLSTVSSSLASDPELAETREAFEDNMRKVGTNRKKIQVHEGASELFSVTNSRLSTPSVMIMPGLLPTSNSATDTSITQDSLKKMYAKALEGKSGTLVLEPFADLLKRENNLSVRSYTSAGLQTMKEAIDEAQEKAVNKGKKLKVTIACMNDDLITRIKSAYAKPEQVLILEEESDSDDDDVELKVDQATVAKALLEASKVENENASIHIPRSENLERKNIQEF